MKPLVSLDVFDTAIFRKVFSPTDIFNIVEGNIGHDFKRKRIEAQNSARKKSIYYNIIDIYKEMQPVLNPKEEIKAEYENCKANPYILNLYNKQEADYIFISDMYLSSTIIKSMLEKCGYKNPQVYVSCELRACKGDGKLFAKVEEILKRKIDKHIGDNYNCDIKGAQRAGIKEVEYIGPAIYNKEVVTPPLKNVKLRKLLIDNELSNKTIEEKIGYMFAPLVLSFTQSVLNEAMENQTIFFNARDSFLMYIVARWILKTKKKIKYCRFSRKSCQLPNIAINYPITHDINKKAMNFFRSLRINNIKELLDTFGFRGNEGILKELGITETTPLDYSTQKNKVIEKYIPAIQDEIYAKVLISRKNFKNYINLLGMKDGDIFVDLGHFGSMQSIIKAITKISLKGRYIHKFEDNEYFKGVIEDKTSFLPVGYVKMYTGIMELVFSEPVGTVVEYTSEGKAILNKDVKFRKEITRAILKGALQGVKDIVEEEIEIPYNDILKVMDRILKQPTLEEAEFANFPLFENGSYDKNESLVWFDRELIRKGKIRECYCRSYWKEAFKLLLEHDKELKVLMGAIK